MEKISEQNPTFGPIVEKTRKILDDKEEVWSKTFDGYADEITQNIKNYKEKGNQIMNGIKDMKKDIELDELQLYSSVTLVKKSKKTAYYDLRFRGQHICSINVAVNGEPKLHFTKDDKTNNEYWFKIKSDFKSKAISLSSPNAKERFKEFCKSEGETKSPEHQLESLILRNLAVTKGEKKVEEFKFMQPIKFGEGFFQMPTPLKGSTHNPEFSIGENGAATGGGIDILTRASKQGVGWRLAVIELKDQNTNIEPVEKVIKQALIYATFIAHLLTNKKCGKKWYNIFREGIKDKNKAVPEELEILVMAMMPPKGEGTNDKIDEEPIEFNIKEKKITLIPCTCYVTPDDKFRKIVKVKGSYLKYKRIPK